MLVRCAVLCSSMRICDHLSVRNTWLESLVRRERNAYKALVFQ